MNITPEIKTKIFALYLGQKILFAHQDKWLDRMFCTTSTLTNIERGLTNHTGLKLVLKSLSQISDEDMIWVYDENHNLHQQRKLYPEDLAKKTPSLKEMKDMISNGFAHYKGGYLDSSSVHQYLISRGYDVPLMALGWKTLQQSELAIYESEN